jgi:negative regulator of sigma E activity
MSKMPEPMPDIVAEQLSAWLDDELPEAELELLIARLRHGSGQQGRLARYGLIGAALRGGDATFDTWRLSDRVRCALDAEAGSATGTAGTGSSPAFVAPDQRWQTNIAPFAAAATVLLTLFLMATLKSPSPTPVAAMPANRPALFGPATVTAERLQPQQFSARTPLSRQRLTNYLVYHGEYTRALAVQAADSRIVNDRGYVAVVQARFEYPPK